MQRYLVLLSLQPHTAIFNVNKTKTYQSDRFDVFKFDVCDAFETSRFVANDQTNVTNISDRRKKFFDIASTTSVR